MRRKPVKNLLIGPIETPYYRITVFRAESAEGEAIPCIRLDPKAPFRKEPRFYTRNMALCEVEALQTGVAMVEELS